MTHTYKIPYGAFELKHSYQKNMLMGTLSTVLLVATIITAGWVYMLLRPIAVEPDIPGQEYVYIPITPPLPSDEIKIEPEKLSVNVDTKNIPKPRFGKLEIGDFPEENSAVPTRKDIEDYYKPGLVGNGGGEKGNYALTPTEPSVPPPDTFVALEEQPIQYLEGKPEYPGLAKAAGLEGEVIIHAYVNREGIVIKALAAKCSRPGIGFEEAAVKAAYKCRYRPGIQNSIPIGAWVTYKVKFVLE